MLTSLLFAAALVLIISLLIAAPFSIRNRLRSAPDRPRSPFEARDVVRMEAAVLTALEPLLTALNRDEGLTDLARFLVLERTAQADNVPLNAEHIYEPAQQHCPDFGGELLAVEGKWIGDVPGSEDDLAAALIKDLGSFRVGGAGYWGLGVAYMHGRAGIVLVLGRLGWRWRNHPPAFGDPSFGVAGEGRPDAARWARLVLEQADGTFEELDVDFDKDGWGRFKVVLGPQRGLVRFWAGPENEAIEVARLHSGPISGFQG